MKTRCNPFLISIFTAVLLAAISAAGDNARPLPLAEGWMIQSSAQTAADGATISQPDFAAAAWHPAAVPTTVLAALVNDGVYTNIFWGTNFAKIPTAPFTNSWWFRKVIDLNANDAAQNADLIFEGINYRANIWLNGQSIANASNVFGAYRIFKFDVSGRLKPGRNILAVEIFPPRPGDFTMGFVDWNPKAPDGEMGLFRPVKLHFYKSVGLENVFVQSRIDHANWQRAQLAIHADLKNASGRALETKVSGQIGTVTFHENFTLQAGETRTVELSAAKHPELTFENARLWWPWELGEPYLYDLKLSASVGDELADATETRFGIREVADYINPDGYRGYEVNGKKLLLRGGGWADELLLREDGQNLRAQLEYTKAMNLNTVRLEGIWGESQGLYDLADELGLLLMVGWSCQWEWKDYVGKNCDNFGGIKSPADQTLATNCLHDQVVWLRNHPSILTWVLGSDKLPRPELETKYDALLAILDPTRPKLKTCGNDSSKVSGPSAVKMKGPYDYVTPNYWYLDSENGGAYGFNTETGPGPQPPPIETLQRMLPADHLWPIDAVWNFHCGRNEFGQMKRYLNAFNQRYGEAKTVEEFAFKSQAANYEAMRAMYEAFAVNLPHTTGVVQWMLNASWPKLYWQLYDYYLTPGGAYFGAQRGAAPVAVIYNYGDQGIYLVNQSGHSLGRQRTTIAVFDLNSKKILEQTVTNASLAYGSQKIFDLAKLSPATPIYFLDLKSISQSGPAGSARNFYWLSTKPDVLDEGKTEWFVTPNKSFANFTALSQMPAAKIQARVAFETFNHFGTGTPTANASVSLTNTSDTLAFFIEMKIVGQESRHMLTPVFWDDNYLSLPPHTSETFHAKFPAGELPELELQGWNVTFENTAVERVNKL